MIVVEDIANVIPIGDCIVIGVGITPENYHSLLKGTTHQDYLVIDAKVSKDAGYIASKMGAEHLRIKPLPVLGLEMNVALVKN